MNRIKILFLTFVLSLTSVGGLACWDDWDDDWDDWGCCDDWDDDDEVDDEHDDWYYNEETGDYWLYDVEVTGSNDGILMDEVIVTYDTGSDDDNDTNNEDTWSDTGDGWGNDDYGWEDGEDDNNDDDSSIVGYGGDNNEGTSDNSAVKYIAQNCQLCCVPTIMAIMNMYAYGISIEDAEKLIVMYRKIYEEMTGKDFYEKGVENKEIASFMKACGFNIAVCSTDVISICLENNFQVFVYIDVYDEHGNKYGHALDIIGITNSGLYECINPLTGKVELHSKEDFKHPIYNYCIKSIDKIY